MLFNHIQPHENRYAEIEFRYKDDVTAGLVYDGCDNAVNKFTGRTFYGIT
jgi:hypothetical protein